MLKESQKSTKIQKHSTMGENTMQLTSILLTLLNVVQAVHQARTNIVGTWSEFGCEQDQIVIKSSDKSS